MYNRENKYKLKKKLYDLKRFNKLFIVYWTTKKKVKKKQTESNTFKS